MRLRSWPFSWERSPIMNNQQSTVETRTNILRHTCPWWFLFTFDNPFRRLYQDPVKILFPYIIEGDFILDLGCGMGYLTIPAAELLGDRGKVVAVDLQQRMLNGLWSRAQKAGLQERIVLHQANQGRIGVEGSFNLALAFWMVHEVQDQRSFLGQIWNLLKPGGKLLVAEPYLHVPRKDFLQTGKILEEIGFTLIDEPEIGFSRTLVVGRD